MWNQTATAAIAPPATPTVKVPPKPYRFLLNSNKRINLLYGGASSGKSWTLALYLILERMFKYENIGIMCVRKTRPAVKASCHRLVKRWLDELGWPYEQNKTELTITSPETGSTMYFEGLDDVEKKKSYENINYIWIEEATEIKEKDFLQLNLRCRAPNPHGFNQLYLSFNPVDPIGNEWLKNRTEAPDSHTQVMVLNHMDNPFLSDEEREQIEALADQDEEFNKIYRLGLWATPTFIIYKNWDTIEHFPSGCETIGYGLDFGYNNPTALIKIGTKDRKHVYLEEVLYETKLTNSQLIEKIKLIVTNRNSTIVADCEAPDRIEEIAQAGFNVWPCHKGPGSVQIGIDRVKRLRLHILRSSVNILTEIRGYKNKVDKNDNILEEPVKFRDHAMDAIRYYLNQPEEVEPEIIVVGKYM